DCECNCLFALDVAMSKTAGTILLLVLLLERIVACPQGSRLDTTSSPQLIPTEIRGKWGYLDGQGQLVIQPRFNEARKFSEGLAAVQMETGEMDKVGSIDKQGTYRIQVVPKTKWGFIDEHGSVAIKPQFEA